MLEKYKTVYEGGEGEIIEKKFQIHCYCASGEYRRRGSGIYRRNEKKLLGCQT